MGLFSPTRTRPITDPQGKPRPASIATMERIVLGGLPQTVVIRGNDARNPLLLWLHGGPGASDLGALQRFNPRLEEHFVVVHWSQRGTTQSFDARATAASMSQAQFLADTEELVGLLLQRFDRRKLFVAGQSIGTSFGYRFVHRHPELVHAYVGVNQVIDRGAEEQRSYELTLQKARALGHRKAVTELEQVGTPVNGQWPTIAGTLTHKNWSRKLGMVTHDPAFFNQFGKAMLLAPEFSWGDLFRFIPSLKRSMHLSWAGFFAYNFFTEVPSIQVPVFLVMGQHDTYMRLDLAEQYLAGLEAPLKELHVFPEAGHMACYEEADRFTDLMIQRVRPLA